MNDWTVSFDTYADSVQEASVLFLKTGPSTGSWGVDWCLLSQTALQFGVNGGPHVVHGVMRPDAMVFIFLSSPAPAQVVLDGQVVTWGEFAVLPPGCDFTFSSRCAPQWISVSLSTTLFDDARIAGLRWLLPLASKAILAVPPVAAMQIVEAATSALSAVRDGGLRAQDGEMDAVESSLLETLSGIFSDQTIAMRRPDEQLMTLEGKMFAVLEYVRSRPSEKITVASLAAAAGVSNRTLLRMFQTYLHMGPKDYLKYRELNLVRRALRKPHFGADHVTRILSEHGVTEFGRFATEYKHLFGELPSETFQRARLRETDLTPGLGSEAADRDTASPH